MEEVHRVFIQVKVVHPRHRRLPNTRTARLDEFSRITRRDDKRTPTHLPFNRALRSVSSLIPVSTGHLHITGA